MDLFIQLFKFILQLTVEKYIKKCLKSIKAQSFKDFECIVIDDGSTDNTLSLINKTVGNDTRFKIISQKNGGLSHARNVGMRQAQGEYLQFIDGDDFVSPQLLEKSVRAMDDSGASFLFYPFFYVTNYSIFKKETWMHCFDDLKEGTIYKPKDYPQLLYQINPAAWNKMWRRDIFVESGINFPFGKHYEDYGTTYRLFPLSSSITYIDEPLYFYRSNISASISNQLRPDRLYDLIDLTDLLVSFYKEHDYFDCYYEELKALVFGNFQYWAMRIIDSGDSECFDFITDFHKCIKESWPEFPEGKYFKPTDKLLDFLSLR